MQTALIKLIGFLLNKGDNDMAVEIKSGSGSDLQTIDAVSKAARVTLYNSLGDEVVPSQPVTIAVSNVVVANNDLIASIDASGYKFISVQLTGTWAGSVQFQGSNDNGTFVPIVVQKTGVILDPYTLTVTANGVIKVPVLFKFLRVRVTAYTSGTVEGFAFGFKESNDTGQISATGTITVAADQTINVGNFPAASPISAATSSIAIGAGAAPLIPLFILGAAGAVNVNSISIRSVPAILRTVVFTNYAATARHFKIYNTASVPVAGAGTPIIVCSLPAGGTLVYPLPLEGFAFTNGIGATMTLGAANNDVTPTATAPDFSVSLIST